MKLLKMKKAELEKKRLKERNKRVKSKKQSYNLEGLQDLRVLSVDLATRSTGVSLFVNGEYKNSGLIQANDENFRVRAYKIIRSIVKTIEKFNVEVVVLEDTFLSLNSKILCMLSETRGMLTYHLAEKGIRLELIPANVWQHGLNFPNNRKEIKEASMKFFKKEIGREAKADDEADSFAIGYYSVNKNL